MFNGRKQGLKKKVVLPEEEFQDHVLNKACEESQVLKSQVQYGIAKILGFSENWWELTQ